MQKLFLPMFALLAGVGLPTFAGTMEGTCFEKVKASFDNKVINGRTFKCNKGGWTTAGSGAHTADSNGFIELYVDDGKAPDSRSELKFRPRRSYECLTGIYDDNRKLLMQAARPVCATNYKSAVAIAIDSGASGVAAVSGAVTTTSKHHDFSAMYMRGASLGIPGDAGYYLVGLFIEAK